MVEREGFREVWKVAKCKQLDKHCARECLCIRDLCLIEICICALT